MSGNFVRGTQTSLISECFVRGTQTKFPGFSGVLFVKHKQNSKNITAAIIGDGGMEEGIVYETLNLASLHKLPIVFICENNNYSVHTNIKTRTKTSNFKNKVKSFDIDYIKISDYKIDKIFNKVNQAFSIVRKKRKPIFIEFDTMRTCSHVGPESDDKEYNYRNRDLLLWKKKNTYKDCGIEFMDQKRFPTKDKGKYNTPTKNIVKISIKEFENVPIHHTKLKHKTEIL